MTAVDGTVGGQAGGQDESLGTQLAGVLAQVVRGGGRLEWDAWFPVAQAVATAPHALQKAVASLGLQEHYELLDRLKADGGPLADYLLCVLAERPEMFDDDQVRSYLLADAGEALARRETELTRMVAHLRSTVTELDRRREAGFDAAIELARLEARRNELREAQMDSDYQELGELEWEIARLETLRARLGDYDPAERTAHRDRLVADTQRLQADRQQTEEQVALAIRARDEALTTLEGARGEQARTESELAAALEESEGSPRRMASLRGEIESLQRETAALRTEIAELEDRHTAVRNELGADEARLADLQSSPLGDSAAGLRDQIRALYASLPDDDIDGRFNNRRTDR